MVPTLEQAKQICADRDYVVLIDESLSMSTADCQNASTRWSFVKEVAGLVCSAAAEYDKDGIDIGLFGSQGGATMHRGVTPGKLSEIMPERPSAMSTFLGQALDDEFKHYFSSGNAKPLTILVLTDGESSDPGVMDKAIRNAGEAAGDSSRVAVAFWQIGYDQGAAKELARLDDEMGEIDIVDTQPMDELIKNLGQIEVPMACAVVD